MPTLDQLAKVIRSKNAGPFYLTLDVLFGDEATYRRVVDSAVITRESMARLYRMPLEKVNVYNHDSALAIKVTLGRWTPAGSLADTDIYGAQQHVPLYSVAVP